MTSAQQLITDNIDVWTSAIKAKSTSGRGSSSKRELYGINKLRELILELAVRGKLVPQNPTDEPASKLLERITVEKAQLIKDKKIKKTKPLPAITEDEKPFALPAGWEWARLGDLICISSGNSFKKEEELNKGQYIYCKVGDMNLLGNEISISTSTSFINPNQKQINSLIPSGSIIFPKRGGAIATNKKRYVKTDIFADSNTMSIKPIYGIRLNYLMLWLSSFDLSSLNTGTSVPQINNKDIEPLIFVLPPLAEQKRIVAKVDELMALCDKLEQETEANLTAHTQLVETLLTALLQSSETQDFNTSWQRIAQHFDTLFTKAESIDVLKQHILQLAVMGKLVPQNPNDEPASKLLERIATEKAVLIAAGKIKKQKPLPAITDEEKPFPLPNGWEWVRLGELFSFLNGFAFKSEWFNKQGIKLLRNINIAHSETKWDEVAYVSESLALEYEKYSLSVGDIVISLDRPIINTGLKYAVIENADLPCLLLQRVAKFHSYANAVVPKYLSRWLESDLFISSIDPGRSNGVPHISTKQLEMMLFPLSPSQLQNDVVVKVEQLISLCDQLKQQLKAAQQTQLHLADAMVEGAL